jgi:hypothetical protein
LIEKWRGRLGGVETFGINHVFIMFQSLRLDDNAKPPVVFFPPDGPRPTATLGRAPDSEPGPTAADARRLVATKPEVRQ